MLKRKPQRKFSKETNLRTFEGKKENSLENLQFPTK